MHDVNENVPEVTQLDIFIIPDTLYFVFFECVSVIFNKAVTLVLTDRLRSLHAKLTNGRLNAIKWRLKLMRRGV